MKNKRIYIIVSVSLCTLIMSIADGVIKPNYLIKSIIKMTLFLLIPLALPIFRKDIKKLFKPTKQIFLALILGVFIYGGIIGGYFLLEEFIDFSAIANNLTIGVGVTAQKFAYVAIYISFVNSLLEEIFFRGFSFLFFSSVSSKKTAYIFSSLTFSLYHLGMTAGWFNIGLWILAIIGLFVGGCLFNLIDEKGKSIYPSWFVHIFANFAINTIGFIMFESL